MSSSPQPAAEPPPAEAVTGTVESIVYRNDETGYTVCTLKTRGGVRFGPCASGRRLA